jgi:hypothetical protein
MRNSKFKIQNLFLHFASCILHLPGASAPARVHLEMRIAAQAIDGDQRRAVA